MAHIDLNLESKKLNGTKPGNIPLPSETHDSEDFSPAMRLFFLRHDIGRISDLNHMIDMAARSLEYETDQDAFLACTQLIQEHVDNITSAHEAICKQLSN